MTIPATPPALARALRTRPTCHDCGAAIGEKHGDGCDVARCLWTGCQRLSCDYWLSCVDPEIDLQSLDRADLHDCGEDTWTGLWPGYEEAIEYDLWVRWIPPAGPGRYGEWRRVTVDDLEARPDLTRLHVDCEWDRNARRWVKRA